MEASRLNTLVPSVGTVQQFTQVGGLRLAEWSSRILMRSILHLRSALAWIWMCGKMLASAAQRCRRISGVVASKLCDEAVEGVAEVADGDDMTRNKSLEPRHKVFLSHSGAQKGFVEQLCVDLERRDRYPFFDRRRDSLPIGSNFPELIFEAIEQCEVGVVVLSEEFFTRSKWPMLELVAMRKNPNLTIIPVFLGLSLQQLSNLESDKRWISEWRGWAKKDDRIDIDGWCAALKALRPINSLAYDGGSEVSFREEIVRAVCAVVLPETRWNDSHVQGKSRLSKVILEKINEAKVSKLYKVRVVGLHGVGGIGKTTICQTLCNEYLTKMHGRVFHAELGSASNVELFRGALKSLTDKSHEVLSTLNMSQCQDMLKREVRKQPVFLAIDNMSDDTKSIEQAKSFLNMGFDNGSIVVVTARSSEVLKMGHLDIDESNVVEMPELEKEEAKALFMEHAVSDREARKMVDEEMIDRCLRRCYFEKGDGRGYHYHPLGLKVLGSQLGFDQAYDGKKWAAVLEDVDTFNRGREKGHPIFSILRKSFDILLPEDQMLFMDVALFLPYEERPFIYSWQAAIEFPFRLFEWLSVVHGISVAKMMERLEGLKRKSVLQDLGDGRSVRVEMHDLWREFAVMECKGGELEGRRWVYEGKEWSDLEEAGSPAGGCWQNVKRMCLRGEGTINVTKINFDHFSNLIVLKLIVDYGVPSTSMVLDVTSMTHLKSLGFENTGIRGKGFVTDVVGLRSVKKLCVLILIEVSLCDESVDEIGHLTNLRILHYSDSRGYRLPDLSKLVLLEEVRFYCELVDTIHGLSSWLNNLRFLHLDGCKMLRSLGPGAGDLVALQELSLGRCSDLEEVPNLQHLTNLRILDIQDCSRISSLRGLDELVALEQLNARWCYKLTEVADLHKLTKLETLLLDACPLNTMPAGMGDLIALRELSIDVERSSAEIMRSVGNLSMLEVLDIDRCTLDEFPDFQRLTNLRILEIRSCEFKDVSGFSGCTALEILALYVCRCLERLPDMHNLTRLQELSISHADVLEDVLGTRHLSHLRRLHLGYLPLVKEVPDLSNFPHLEYLSLDGCAKLVRVTSSKPLAALSYVSLAGCRSLNALPDLSEYFPALVWLNLRGCGSLRELICSERLPSLRFLRLEGCDSLNTLPDLQTFPGLDSEARQFWENDVEKLN